MTLISLGLGSPKSSTLALACVLLAGWGSAVAWLKFLADNLNRFGPTPLPQAVYIAILAVPLTLCAWVEDCFFFGSESSSEEMGKASGYKKLGPKTHKPFRKVNVTSTDWYSRYRYM